MPHACPCFVGAQGEILQAVQAPPDASVAAPHLQRCHKNYFIPMPMPIPKTISVPPNPFALLMDPQSVQTCIVRSTALNQLQRRQYHPLECTVMRSASGEQAEFDRKVDPTTVYLAPGDWAPPVRPMR